MRKLMCFVGIHRYGLFGYGSVDRYFYERCRHCGKQRRTDIKHDL